MRTTQSKALAAALISIALLGAPVAAHAETTEESDGVHSIGETELRSFLSKYDVNEPTQEALMKKLEAGQTWDSINASSVPTDVEEKAVGRDIETVSTFMDGSITVDTAPDFEGDVEKANDDSPSRIEAQAVKQCKFKKAGSYGGYWTNCKATQNSGIIGMSFRFNYQNIKQSGAKITKYGNGDFHIFGGTISKLKFKKTSSKNGSLQW